MVSPCYNFTSGATTEMTLSHWPDDLGLPSKLLWFYHGVWWEPSSTMLIWCHFSFPPPTIMSSDKQQPMAVLGKMQAQERNLSFPFSNLDGCTQTLLHNGSTAVIASTYPWSWGTCCPFLHLPSFSLLAHAKLQIWCWLSVPPLAGKTSSLFLSPFYQTAL